MGIFEDVLCMGKETTYQFLEDVFTEITELFPRNTYILVRMNVLKYVGKFALIVRQ